MGFDELTMGNVPALANTTMLVALTGWMDGGEVSTGTVEGLMERRKTVEIGRIDPDTFYLYNFPASMEVASIFRPEVKYKEGVVEEFAFPTNVFYADAGANLVFFVGKEPNLRWQAFADAIFEMVRVTRTVRIVFVGSFGGTVPHTREPRLFGSVSHEHLKAVLKGQGMRLSDYGGPASFSTLLLHQAPRHAVEMLSLVAEIPGYLQGRNPVSIEAITRRVARMLNLAVDMDEMRAASNAWELQVTEAVEKDEKLAATVRDLEEQYDNQLITPEET